ncbi:unnamed protein product [Didymodactylos carnosus]|uniref:V-SNARE coiled-coil homology domain-containing protein n=1 Tax=Didymodactylos carnosus TaxID=1234261 RepID=A0A813Z5J1_9BILA|nr:unnamed protein product [Didymodactylos carnosus]CAF0893707.1 unnamed protein product [Didymodactylos carnosus]CAF3573185.1 unnamed protein product [Didymodactylos carnosus]CAF3677502.1 unnamed protein product [Didymodactylos carnosus]
MSESYRSRLSLFQQGVEQALDDSQYNREKILKLNDPMLLVAENTHLLSEETKKWEHKSAQAAKQAKKLYNTQWWESKLCKIFFIVLLIIGLVIGFIFIGNHFIWSTSRQIIQPKSVTTKETNVFKIKQNKRKNKILSTIDIRFINDR